MKLYGTKAKLNDTAFSLGCPIKHPRVKRSTMDDKGNHISFVECVELDLHYTSLKDQQY
jgi:hypothetical protein